LLFDIISLKVIEKLGLSLEETKQFHANIEWVKNGKISYFYNYLWN
jgi:hypothetical protein